MIYLVARNGTKKSYLRFVLQTITKPICNLKAIQQKLPTRKNYVNNYKIKFAIYCKTICNSKSKYSQKLLIKFILATANITLLHKFTFSAVLYRFPQHILDFLVI